MTDQQFDDSDRVSEPEAARRLGISRRTLRRWRNRNDGSAPPYLQYPSSTIRYPLADLLEWFESHRHGADVDGRQGEGVNS